MTATIGILLATYNGARFLQEQLDSLEAQTFRDWHLYARDDGSDDGTVALLQDFAALHPARVSLVQDGLGRLGARGSFGQLMGLAREPYIAFCDQDDIWRFDKLELALSRLQGLEAGRPAGTPCLVHADRALIDVDGVEITPSYWRSRGLRPSTLTPESCLSFCVAAGAAMLVNRPLISLAHPVPPSARMYDCWLEIIAHLMGAVATIETIALDHRRHGANTSGSTADIDSPSRRRFAARVMRFLSSTERQRGIYAVYFAQAAALRIRFGHRLTTEARRRLDLFLSVPDRWLPGRLLRLLQSRAIPPGGLRLLAMALLSADRRAERARGPQDRRAVSR